MKLVFYRLFVSIHDSCVKTFDFSLMYIRDGKGKKKMKTSKFDDSTAGLSDMLNKEETITNITYQVDKSGLEKHLIVQKQTLHYST